MVMTNIDKQIMIGVPRPIILSLSLPHTIVTPGSSQVSISKFHYARVSMTVLLFLLYFNNELRREPK